MYDNNTNVGVGTTTPGYKLEVNGSFAATTKSFVIKHPTKENKKLQYGVAEGPEHSVFVRGKLINNNRIDLPDYWCAFVDSDTITVQLTPIDKFQKLYVSQVDCRSVYISSEDNSPIECYYFVQAERRDIPKLEVEV